MRILTSHTAENPLLGSLEDIGIRIEYVSPNQAINAQEWSGVLGYYGNLFDEIKSLPSLMKLKRKLSVHNVTYFFWNRDAPWNVGMKLHSQIVMRLLKPVDIYLAHSIQGARDFGGSVHYFPNAAQAAYYADTDLQALRDESAYQYDVSFFGSFGNKKDRNAIARQQFFEALKHLLELAVPGIRFKAVDTSAASLTLEEQLALIRKTKINLNYGAMCDLPDYPSWGVPERLFGISAAGGLVISDVRKNLVDTFPPGLVPVFNQPKTCAQTIIELLDNFGRIRTLAEAQHHHVLAGHTYRHRAQHLLNILQSYQKSI